MNHHEKTRKEIEQRTKREETTTHECPECGGPAYCAMEAGKSINNCWCMYETSTVADQITSDTCMCRNCLTGEA